MVLRCSNPIPKLESITEQCGQPPAVQMIFPFLFNGEKGQKASSKCMFSRGIHIEKRLRFMYNYMHLQFTCNVSNNSLRFILSGTRTCDVMPNG